MPPAKKAVTTKASTPEATPEVPEVPEAPEAPEAPETPETPEAPEAPASEPAPETPEAPKATPEEWLERSRALAEKSAQAETAALAAIAAERRIPPVIPTEEVVKVVAKRDDAETILRALAKSFGYRLVLAHRKVA